MGISSVPSASIVSQAGLMSLSLSSSTKCVFTRNTTFVNISGSSVAVSFNTNSTSFTFFNNTFSDVIGGSNVMEGFKFIF
jgi:hypothetical protein